MSLELRTVAECETCATRRVLYTESEVEAARALYAFGWRWAVPGDHDSIQCATCVAKITEDPRQWTNNNSTAHGRTKVGSGARPKGAATSGRGARGSISSGVVAQRRTSAADGAPTGTRSPARSACGSTAR